MRTSVIILGVVLVIIFGLVFWRWGDNQGLFKKTDQPTITLTGMSADLCPATAEVAITDITQTTKVLVERSVAIQNCRTISLPIPVGFKSQQTYAYVRIPRALAFKVTVDPGNPEINYAPEFGDVDDNNIIDRADQDTISTHLFEKAETASSANGQFDVDGDKQITVNDLSLSRLNSGVGVSRPDNKSWRKTL
jgi:hypothetical protein